jgi:hypothetical protein
MYQVRCGESRRSGLCNTSARLNRFGERPLSDSATGRLNGKDGRKSAIKGGVLDARLWPFTDEAVCTANVRCGSIAAKPERYQASDFDH